MSPQTVTGHFCAAAVSAREYGRWAAETGWTYDRLDVGFILEDLSCLFTQPLDVGLGQLLAGHQALDPAVEGRD